MVSKTFNIFWTAGWDSTYRVLDLVLRKKQTVQPYYVIDRKRKSNKIEQEKIDKMKSMMLSIDPTVEKRLLPIKKIYKDKIPENQTIRNKFYDLRAAGEFLGSQHVFLASFADYSNMNDIELCIHKDDQVHDYLIGNIEEYEDEAGKNYKLKHNLSNNNLEIFKYYRFPLFDISKLDMQNFAKQNGFAHIMEETWFCHHPYKGNQPCGLCNPCRYTREEGLGRRVPTPSRFRKVKYDTRINLLKSLAQVKKKIRRS